MSTEPSHPAHEPPVVPPAPQDRRGADDAPRWGRRMEDEPVHQMVRELRAIRTQAEGREWSLKRTVAIVVGLGILYTAALKVLGFLGGGINGPGASFEQFKREQIERDRVAALERRAVLNAVESISGTVARWGYDMCMKEGAKGQVACFDAYITQSRAPIAALPPVPPSHAEPLP